jgi:hypothetical protein
MANMQRAAIVLHLADGGFPDPNRIADDIPESHGWRQLKKRITILSAADLDAAIPFIEAAYRTEIDAPTGGAVVRFESRMTGCP